MIKLKAANIKLEYYLIGLILLIAAWYVYGFVGKFIHMDEAIIGEHVYWFSKLGYVKSQLFVGMGQGWETRQFFYHKAFVWLGALVTQCFGFSLFNLRMISLLSFIIFVFLLWKYLISKVHTKHSLIFLVALLVLLANVYTFEFSFLYRPEMLMMTLGFSTFLLLDRAIIRKNNSPALFAGVLAGISVVVHLNGLAFVAAGFLFLVLHKRFWLSVLFGAISVPFILLFFADAADTASLNKMYSEFMNHPEIQSKSTIGLSYLVKLLKEHERFFHSPKEIAFTVLSLVSLWFIRGHITQDTKRMLIYLAALIFSLALVSHGKTAKYGILYYPYMAIICGLALFEFRSNRPKIFILTGILSVYMGIQIYYTNRWVGLSEVRRDQYVRMKEVIPTNSKVIGPDSFMFEGIENYQYFGYWGIIYSFTDYTKSELSSLEFLNFLRKYEFGYLIFDKGIPKMASKNTEELIDTLEQSNFKRVLETSDYLILKSNQ